MTKTSTLQSFMNEVWNQQNFDAVEKYLAPSYTIHFDNADPWEGKVLSHDDFKARLKYSFDSFPDMHFDIQMSIEDGNQVAIHWIMIGTNFGKMGTVPATNKSIRTNGITIYHFEGDKICGHTQVFDRKAVMRQLGF